MRLPALTHLIESVQALSRCHRLRVLGSGALLASFPQLGEAGHPLELTYDADFLIEPCDEALAAMLHEAVGEGSLFAQRTGFHADILRPQIVETLPPGWETRLVPLRMPGDNAALGPEDVALTKLRLGREKDLELCRHLLGLQLVACPALRRLIEQTPMSEAEIVRVHDRLRRVEA
jgi:hypothetical protein